MNFSGSVDKDGSISINDTSDEEGYLYPDITITLKSAGDLKITNEYDKRTTVVRGCSSGETLTFTHLCKLCQVIILMSWVMILIISLYELTMSMAKQLIN